MKHIRMILAAMMLLAVSLQSKAWTQADVDSFKNSILSWVREEGYAPKIDADGDVMFKYQGENYWISVEGYDDGYYVTFMSMTDLEDLDTGQILVALDQAEKSLKYVRCYTTQDYRYAVMQICSYCSTLSHFKEMFPIAMEIIPEADTRFINHMIELIGD